jgi:predicted TPR repeat methyltransferase
MSPDGTATGRFAAEKHCRAVAVAAVSGPAAVPALHEHVPGVGLPLPPGRIVRRTVVGSSALPVYSGTMDIEAVWKAALAHQRAGRLVDAARGYRQLLEHVPEHSGALNFLGIIAIQTNQPQQAVELLQRAVAARPEMPELHNNLGLALQRTGRLDTALPAFERAVALKPELADAHYNLAVAARLAGQTARAEQAYRAALEHDSRLASAYVELGALLQGERRLDEAAAVYRRALAIRDDYAPILSNLALVLHQQGKLDEAIGLAERAASADLGSAELATNLGILLQERGRLDEADAAFARAIAVKPGYAPAQSHAGLLAHERGRTETAIGHFRTVLALKPGDEDARYMLAVLTGERLTRAPDGYVGRLFDQYAARFDEHLTGTLGYRAPTDLAALIASIDRDRVRGTVLDIGCGTGLSGLPFRDTARRLIGVDLSAEMLGRARARNLYDELHCAEACAFLAGFSGAIDLAVAADMLVYLGDPAPLLDALADRLPPGGLFALSIERLDEGTFALGSSGRFSHNPDHLAMLGAGCGFALRAAHDTVIRHERRAPAHGSLMVFEKV